jgi:aminotransferase
MKESYWRRRNFLYQAFNEMGLPCNKPEGAFYMFPQIRDLGLSAKEFALKFLDEHQVAAVPGTAFGACGEGHLRCCYATSMEELQTAMGRMKQFVDGLR